MSQPVQRADGTLGRAVDLVVGQPLTDSRYAGATPANEVQYVNVYTDGTAVVLSQFLTCDPPAVTLSGFVFPASFFGYDGDYPVYRFTTYSGPGPTCPGCGLGGLTGVTTAPATRTRTWNASISVLPELLLGVGYTIEVGTPLRRGRFDFCFLRHARRVCDSYLWNTSLVDYTPLPGDGSGGHQYFTIRHGGHVLTRAVTRITN